MNTRKPTIIYCLSSRKNILPLKIESMCIAMAFQLTSGMGNLHIAFTKPYAQRNEDNYCNNLLHTPSSRNLIVTKPPCTMLYLQGGADVKLAFTPENALLISLIMLFCYVSPLCRWSRIRLTIHPYYMTEQQPPEFPAGAYGSYTESILYPKMMRGECTSRLSTVPQTDGTMKSFVLFVYEIMLL